MEGPTARRAGWRQVSSSSRHRLLDSVPGTVLVASRVSGTWASIQVASSGMATYKSRRRLVKLGTLPQLTPLQGGGSTSEQAAPYSLPPAYGETDGESRGLTRQHLSHLSLKRGVPGGCWGAWGMATVPLVRALAQTQGSGSDDPGAEAPPEVFKSKNLVPHSTLQPPLKPHLRLPVRLSAAPREQPTGRRASAF